MVRTLWMGMLLLVTLSLSGCDLVGDVLEFGFWAVVIVTIVLIALVVWAFKKLF